ncbi:LamG-like jellyroll fold domain-containing protein, partial [Verrucomicrobiota bacterium]
EDAASIAYNDRNPVWLCGGVEVDSPRGKVIKWSQPEIVLYDDDPFVRMSYPDLVEEGGRFFLTETQKDIARVHEVDPSLLHGMWSQFDRAEPALDGLMLELPEAGAAVPGEAAMPLLPAFCVRDVGRGDHGTGDLRQGFALDLWLRFDTLGAGQVVFDARTADSRGLALCLTEKARLELRMGDGRTENRWSSDAGLLKRNVAHHVAVIVDGGPKIITFVVDGRLCDGGDERQFGWGRFSPFLRDANGAARVKIAPRLKGEVLGLRLYGRYLRTSEAVANWRAGPPARA